jgi:hypothetical protein
MERTTTILEKATYLLSIYLSRSKIVGKFARKLTPGATGNVQFPVVLFTISPLWSTVAITIKSELLM